jgi:fructose-1,6-bisphosphatase/inositol monophosphatase family enzyme
MTEAGDAIVRDAVDGLLPVLKRLHRRIRSEVVEACRERATEDLARVASETGGDTIYAVDKVSEMLILNELNREARSLGGLVVIAEGFETPLTLPLGSDPQLARFRLLIDPIDGSRGLMYQKRSAWILTGVAPNRGEETRLSDIALAVQTEIPLVKQYLADELSAVRGYGVTAERHDLVSGGVVPMLLRPSSAETIEHGYAMLSRFFPGARDEIAAVDEEIVRGVLGPPLPGRAACFEDQYASSAGQLYELMAGHDRFNADLRPLFEPILRRRGEAPGLYCHPYDVSTALIAREAGVVITAANGGPLDAPFSLHHPVAWIGYANRRLQRLIQPVLQASLRRRRLL